MNENTKLYEIPIEHSFIPKDIPPTRDEPIGLAWVQGEIALEEAIDSINRRIQEREGFVLGDGQILTNTISISDVLDYGINRIDINGICQFSRREWGVKQKEYFKIENPYQLSEDNGKYSYGWILTDSHENYLQESERILALLHGENDQRRPFYCTCHYAQVVFTSNQRFVCMMCGMLHCVLEKTFNRRFVHSMTAEEWFDYFDQEGARQEKEIDLEIIDFQDVENLPKIWTTDQFEESVNELVFFARSSKEELDQYYKTSGNPEALIEAGFSLEPQVPEPIFQIAKSKHSVDRVANALSSFVEGVLAYQKGKTQPIYIKFATLHLFHAIDILLKICLEQTDPSVLGNNANNPTIIKLIQNKGIHLSAEEYEMINSLRRLRNAFQHDKASYNYRSALSLLQKSMIFVDRFTVEELDIWLAEEIGEEAWQILLKIEPIRINAEKIANEVLELVRSESDDEISFCPICKRKTLVSKANTGSLCIYCRHRPTLEELQLDDTDI